MVSPRYEYTLSLCLTTNTQLKPQQRCSAACRHSGPLTRRPGLSRQKLNSCCGGSPLTGTKHAHVVASLDEHTAAKVADILEASITAEDKYTTLKQQFLEWFQLSEQQHTRRLLEFCGLGDRKPSELMEEILALLQDEPFSFIGKEIYLQRLPPVVRAQLANTDFKTNPQVAATLANKLWFAACRRTHTSFC